MIAAAPPSGTVVGDIDVAQLLVVAFFLFFIGLVLYLRREDKREGYPLIDPAGGGDGEGFPAIPPPKTFRLPGGGVVAAPHADPQPDIAAKRAFPFPGSPMAPTGDPVVDGIGPAAFALRREAPLYYAPDIPQLAPLRSATDWTVLPDDPDPRGMAVVGRDGKPVGVVRDLWIDRGVKIIRYLEVELDAGLGGRRALVPIHHTEVSRRRNRVWVRAISAARFADAPQIASRDVITAREEDRVNAFYVGGRFFDKAPLARLLEARARS